MQEESRFSGFAPSNHNSWGPHFLGSSKAVFRPQFQNSLSRRLCGEIRRGGSVASQLVCDGLSPVQPASRAVSA